MALVSAYDLHYKLLQGDLAVPECLIVDSGGYEATIDSDLSDFYGREYHARIWDRTSWSTTLQALPSQLNTCAVSYDGPNDWRDVDGQLSSALDWAGENPEIGHTFLLKRETAAVKYSPIAKLIPKIERLGGFSAVGVTEKELGRSYFERMKNIAKIRDAMQSAGLNLPIHVFGALDPIAVPLYFLSGADIFDGLTWLRLYFHDDFASYLQPFTAKRYGIRTPVDQALSRAIADNFYFLGRLRDRLLRFLVESSFGVFDANEQFFREGIQLLNQELRT